VFEQLESAIVADDDATLAKLFGVSCATPARVIPRGLEAE
jgi:hypothetical protein